MIHLGYIEYLRGLKTQKCFLLAKPHEIPHQPENMLNSNMKRSLLQKKTNNQFGWILVVKSESKWYDTQCNMARWG